MEQAPETRRRSPRILARIPILIVSEGPVYNAHTAVVNRHGALILSPVEYPAEAIVEVQNLNTGESAQARIVWCGGLDHPGTYKLGMELVADLPEFWAVDYEAALAAGSQKV